MSTDTILEPTTSNLRARCDALMADIAGVPATEKGFLLADNRAQTLARLMVGHLGEVNWSEHFNAESVHVIQAIALEYVASTKAYNIEFKGMDGLLALLGLPSDKMYGLLQSAWANVRDYGDWSEMFYGAVSRFLGLPSITWHDQTGAHKSIYSVLQERLKANGFTVGGDLPEGYVFE